MGFTFAASNSSDSVFDGDLGFTDNVSGAHAGTATIFRSLKEKPLFRRQRFIDGQSVVDTNSV